VQSVIDKQLKELAAAVGPTMGFHIRWGDKIEEDILFVSILSPTRSSLAMRQRSDCVVSVRAAHFEKLYVVIESVYVWRRNGPPRTPRTTSPPSPKTSQMSRLVAPASGWAILCAASTVLLTDASAFIDEPEGHVAVL
jgi:hypothetical protein